VVAAGAVADATTVGAVVVATVVDEDREDSPAGLPTPGVVGASVCGGATRRPN
jgi:hypothetical protein